MATRRTMFSKEKALQQRHKLHFAHFIELERKTFREVGSRMVALKCWKLGGWSRCGRFIPKKRHFAQFIEPKRGT